MTLVLVDILDNAVIVAVDRFQRLGGGSSVTENNQAVKLVSNRHLLVAVYGDWPISQPTHCPNVWLAEWLKDHPDVVHAKDAAPILQADLEKLQVPAHVKGGGIIVASCTKEGPDVIEISGGSTSEKDWRLCLSRSTLASLSGDPIPRGVFSNWRDLATRTRLPSAPSRSNSGKRERFLRCVIARCEKCGIPGVLGPALSESKSA